MLLTAPEGILISVHNFLNLANRKGFHKKIKTMVLFKIPLSCTFKNWAAALLVFCSTSVSAQGILAGDTSSAGIVFIDIDNFWVSATYPWNYIDEELIDINDDGVYDLKFWAMDDAAGHVSIERTKIYGLNGAQIVYYELQPYWVDELEDGMIIDSGSLWSDAGTLRYRRWFPDTIEEGGIFTSGYAGFRIPDNAGYLYGWVHLYASFTSIHVYDYAYQSLETGLPQQSEIVQIKMFPNPAVNRLHVHIAPNHGFDRVNIYNIAGEKMRSLVLAEHQSYMSIDVEDLPDGIYILKMTGRSVFSSRFMKYSR